MISTPIRIKIGISPKHVPLWLLMYPPIGLGVLPVLVTLAVAGIAGIMTARLMGLMLDGIEMRHLFRFAAESLILGGLWTWFVKLSA